MHSPASSLYRSTQLVPLFERMLRLCKLREDESLVVVASATRSGVFERNRTRRASGVSSAKTDTFAPAIGAAS